MGGGGGSWRAGCPGGLLPLPLPSLHPATSASGTMRGLQPRRAAKVPPLQPCFCSHQHRSSEPPTLTACSGLGRRSHLDHTHLTQNCPRAPGVLGERRVHLNSCTNHSCREQRPPSCLCQVHGGRLSKVRGELAKWTDHRVRPQGH